MKRYILQFQAFKYDPWEAMPSRQYDTLEEARAAYDALPVKDGYRIAESYVQVRYKPVKL